MAVYTVLEQADIAALVEPFGIGPLVAFHGATDGIENTTYFITTDHSQLASENFTADQQEYVLTIFEEIPEQDLAYYVALTTQLADQHLPVPAPLRDYNGHAIQRAADKPALLFPKAAGSHPMPNSVEQCAVIGQTMARMHLASQQLDLQHEGNRSFQWLQDSARQALPFVGEDDQQLINQQLDNFAEQVLDQPSIAQALPVGIIHNDLFRDNTLFEGDELTAIIDFYNACNGYLLTDVAITLNDWCSQADGSLDDTRYQAFITGYQQVRPLTGEERSVWPLFLAVAATRFWVSRLLARHTPTEAHRKGALFQQKDPDQYRQILLERLQHTPLLPY